MYVNVTTYCLLVCSLLVMHVPNKCVWSHDCAVTSEKSSDFLAQYKLLSLR